MAKPDLSGLDLDGLNAVIAEATKLRDKKVEEKRAELMKQLAELDALSSSNGVSAKARPVAKALYRTPDGSTEWSGRGGIPRAFKDLGVADKADMQKYLIKD